MGAAWIRLRTDIPEQYELLAMHNYSLFYYAAIARQAIDEDRRRLQAGEYPQPERFFSASQICSDRSKNLQNLASVLLHEVGIDWKFPKQPESVYQTVAAYRNAFAHDPVLGRAIDQGRELLPPEHLLPEKGKPLLWRTTSKIPSSQMVCAGI